MITSMMYYCLLTDALRVLSLSLFLFYRLGADFVSFVLGKKDRVQERLPYTPRMEKIYVMWAEGSFHVFE